MNRDNRWFSASGLFGPGRIGKSKRPECPRGRRRFRPVVTGLEDRRLLTSYTLTTLALFNGANGEDPDGVVLDGQGNLYGATEWGGAYGIGTVYEIANGTNTVKTLASFDSEIHVSPANPTGGMVLDAQGNLYGTTLNGGLGLDGAVFEITKGSNTIKTLASFNGNDGANPYAGVVLDGQGNLYGTTHNGGGVREWGTVFEIAGSNIINDVSFTGTNQGDPAGGVVLDAQGNLYGTTNSGGAYGHGAVFEIAQGSNTIKTLASFNGEYTNAGLVMDGQGNLYGTTVDGGTYGQGTVFELAQGLNTIKTLASFDGTNGEDPQADMVMDGQGNLYGTTNSGGSNGVGTVFEITQGSNTITDLFSFDYANGADPIGGVVLDTQGNLYGTTLSGVAYDYFGTVFELSPQRTTETVTSSPSPSVYGQSVTLSATVVPSTATGTVTFYDGTRRLGTGTLDDGTATLATSALPIGSDAITAFYNGDANDPAGTSPVFNQVVNQDASAVSVISSVNPSVFGQSVTFTATVSVTAPGGGTPTGSVTFFDGTTDLGTGTLDDGTATLATTALPVGSDAITASYSGDANDVADTSPVFNQVVNAANSQSYSIAINGQDGPWEFVEGGLNTNYSYGVGDQQPPATVTSADGLSFASGSVFDIQYVSGLEYDGKGGYNDANGLTSYPPANGYNGSNGNLPSYYFVSTDWPAYEGEVVGTFADSNGRIVGTPFNIGDQRTVVVPAGASQLEMGFNDNYYEDNLGSITMEVTAMPELSVTGTSNPNPSVYGQSVTLSATVVPSTATGMVMFYDGTTSLGTATLVNGTATLATTALPVGANEITASYGGDPNDPAGTSPVFNQVVNQDASADSVMASVNPSVSGQSVTFTAMVTAASPGSGTPTGTVTFMDGSATLGTGTLNGSGVATLSTASLPTGTDSITAVYSGDANFTTSTSGSFLQVVNPLLSVSSITAVSPNPRNAPVTVIDITLNVPINSSNLSPGALTLTDNGGPDLLTGAVSLTRVTNNTYAIGGLAGLTTAQGLYSLTVNATDITDTYGNSGTGTLSTSWLMDTTPPTSTVSPLPKVGTSLIFPITVTGTVPVEPAGSPTVDIASFNVYVSANGGAWTLWQTLTPSAGSPNTASAVFAGTSNTMYAFYSTAKDNAGNAQAYNPSIEASTDLPGLNTPVTSVASSSSYNTATATFTLNLTGTDTGGSGLAYFEVFAAVDAGYFSEVGMAIPAGVASNSGTYQASIEYQGLTDGVSHSYRFFSIGIDAAGLVQPAPSMPDVTDTNVTFQPPSQLAVTGLTVENGAAERSYIRYLDVLFNESDSQSGSALSTIAGSAATTTPKISLYQYDLAGDASSKVAVPLANVNVSVIDHAIEIEFGPGGIGGNSSTTAADGYYELDVVLPDGQTAIHHFYRLLGDVNGDGTVDQNDLNAVAAARGQSVSQIATASGQPATGLTALNMDVNGDGSVNTTDLALATKSKGNSLGSNLPLG